MNEIVCRYSAVSEKDICDSEDDPKMSQNMKNSVYDALGPFPDEPFMMAVDRLLYYSGVSKMLGCGQKSSQCTKPKASCKFGCKPKCKAAIRGCGTPTPSETASCSSRLRTPRVDFANAVEGFDMGGPSCSDSRSKSKNEYSSCDDKLDNPNFGQRIKRSFSLCSLACRKLKDKAATHVHSSESGDCVRVNNPPKWLWTRLQCQSNGYKVYEVYKDSDSKSDPHTLEKNDGPAIIFVVLPNGHIMPFESVKFH